ncbi:MAG: T9SS type A sorting domain-containing protein [Bacteroidetes bacterium]|nr:T9SS type A sorting domain-containing protein [Bacteroidota bacterium]
MKKLYFIYLVLAFIFNSSILSSRCFSQWQAVVLLSETSSNSVTCEESKSIASTGNFVHAVWADLRNGNSNNLNWDIYYKRSNDHGLTWSEDIQLTNEIEESFYPNIAVSNSDVHVIWMEHRSSNAGIYYKHSTDAGLTWSPDIFLVNSSTGNINFPSLAVSGSTIHLVWEDAIDGNTEIFYKRSINGGVTWDPNVRLTNNSNQSGYPRVAVSESEVHVIWTDDRYGYPNFEILYKRSTDGGVTWGEDTRLTNDPAYSSYPELAVSGSAVHVVWLDSRIASDYEMFYKRSVDGGLNWEADTPITNSGAFNLGVVASDTLVHLLWNGTPNGTTYMRSTDKGRSWSDTTCLTNSIPGNFPSMSVSDSVVHVLWSLAADMNSNSKVYYKRNPTGNVIRDIKYTLNFSVIGSNGSISATVDNNTIATGDQVIEGNDIVFAATPETGYRVKEWKLNSVVVNGNKTNSYILSNITAVAIVSVEFEIASDINNHESDEKNVELYPNPATEKVILNINNSKNEDFEITIYNITGGFVRSEKLNKNKLQINTGDLSNGLYTIAIKSNSIKEYKKLIINK